VKKYADFMAYKDEIEDLVFDRAKMPLAKRTFDHFWSRGQADLLAGFLASATDANGNAMQPGRPIASSPYPSTIPAVVQTNADLKRYMATNSTITLNGSNSEFANAYNWAVTLAPTGAIYSLTAANTPTPSFTPNADGDYTLELTVTNALGMTSAPASIVVNASSTYTPVSFANELMMVFDRTQGEYLYPVATPQKLHPFQRCIICHSRREELLTYEGPSSRSHTVNYNANTYLWSLSGPAAEVYNNLLDRVDLNNPLESRLLNAGSKSHHRPDNPQGWGFDDTNNDWQHFNTLLRWVNEGAPNN